MSTPERETVRQTETEKVTEPAPTEPETPDQGDDGNDQGSNDK